MAPDPTTMLAAGPLSSWLAQAEEGRADVPCGDCTACCRSGYFVHVEPDETATLARIPAELLFPAPGLPDGHMVLGYDREGRCPMLRAGGCSIYHDRPRTCRRFDCRVFAATGVLPDGGDDLIAQQVRRWAFSHPTEADRAAAHAVEAAVTYLGDHPEVFPQDAWPPRVGDLATLAVRIHRLFLAAEPPGADDVRAALRR